MRGEHLRRRLQELPSHPSFAAGRTFVVRRTALGYRALVHHAYGRVTRLGPPARDGRPNFSDGVQVARALAREALRRGPREAEVTQVAALLAGPGWRWELHEDEVRAAAGRARRVAA